MQEKRSKTWLAYLKTIDNARDDLAVRRIINVPKRGIGATTLNRVADYAAAADISFYNALKMADDIPTLGKSAAKIKPFVNFIQVMRSKVEIISVSELLRGDYRRNRICERIGSGRYRRGKGAY